jgi:small-conductance mechanosensitive channel/CRP-like cAMP-binding protein
VGYLSSLKIPDPLVFAASFLVLGYFARRIIPVSRATWRLFCQVFAFAGLTAMLLLAGVVPSDPTPIIGQSFLFISISILKILWWLTCSWLIVGLVHALFKPKLQQTRFAQDIVSGVIYILAVLAIISNVFDLPVGGLLTASGVIAIVLGLALQSTLADVFSGVVLNISKPYRSGDWVILDGGLEGRVVESNWRAMQLLTDANDFATVPNSVITKCKLVNASFPYFAHGVSIVMRFEPALSPSRICAVLRTALLGCSKVLRSPAPDVIIRKLDALALECELKFFISTAQADQKKQNQLFDAEIQNEVFDLVFRHCASVGVRLAPPPESSVVLPPLPTFFNPDDVPRHLLDHLKLFKALSEKERMELEPKMRRVDFKAGDIVVQPGLPATSLSIVSAGILVALQDVGTVETETLRLNPGDSLGEAGVLTSASIAFKVVALTNATVYEISRDDLKPFLKNRPVIADEFAKILARRQAIGQHLLEQDTGLDNHVPNLAARMADRMRDIFGLNE